MDTFLEAALDEARKGRKEGGIPIGSVLVQAPTRGTCVQRLLCLGWSLTNLYFVAHMPAH